MKLKETKKIKEEEKTVLKNVFKDLGKREKKKGGKAEEDGKKRKMTALEEIMEMEKRRKKSEKVEEEPAASSPPWLHKNIIVKIMTKSLGDKYYKKKGYVKVGHFMALETLVLNARVLIFLLTCVF